jgi:hypothetical protein
MSAKNPSKRAEFVKLREAYDLLSEIYRMGGTAERGPKGVKLGRIPRDQWSDITGRLRGCEELVLQLVEGPGERRSMADKTEVVLAAIEIRRDGKPQCIEVCALEVQGRSKVTSSLCVETGQVDWKEKLSGFVDWRKIDGVISAADGNNQRAVIGTVLSLAGIGRGTLSMVEVEIPQEIDEATHLVRGSEWMKAGLPRFGSASSEALWYLMRARSVHSRVFRIKKQGFYTSMALTAMFASGLTTEQISQVSEMPENLVEKLIFTSKDEKASDRDFEFVHDFVFDGEMKDVSVKQINAAMRVWRGSAIFKRGMEWRITISRKSRESLFEGKDLIEVAESFRIQRRELVRILSVSLAEAVFERDHFLSGVLSLQTLRDVCRL